MSVIRLVRFPLYWGALLVFLNMPSPAAGIDAQPTGLQLWAQAAAAQDTTWVADTSSRHALGPRVTGTPRDVQPYTPPRGFFNSPTGALLRSVAFPGWGQWFNGKKTKAVLVMAVEGYFASRALVWRHRARESGIDFATFDQARDRRNYFYWLTGLTVFISMFDAYGDRYLIALERTRDAGDDYWGGHKSAPEAHLTPTAENWRLSLSLRF